MYAKLFLIAAVLAGANAAPTGKNGISKALGLASRKLINTIPYEFESPQARDAGCVETDTEFCFGEGITTSCAAMCQEPLSNLLQCDAVLETCDALCSNSSYNALVDCVTCMVETGDPELDAYEAQFGLGEVAGICMYLGEPIDDEPYVTAVATTTEAIETVTLSFSYDTRDETTLATPTATSTPAITSKAA